MHVDRKGAATEAAVQQATAQFPMDDRTAVNSAGDEPLR